MLPTERAPRGVRVFVSTLVGVASLLSSVTPLPAPSAAPPPITSVVTLGDSVPSGTACRCTPYPLLLGSVLAQRQHRAVKATDLARSGETSRSMLTYLDSPAVQRFVKGADVVVLEVGANDFSSAPLRRIACRNPYAAGCYGSQLVATKTRLNQIVTKVRGMTRARIVMLGYWNIFLDGAVGRAQGATYVRNSDAVTRAFNAVAHVGNTTYADTYTPFKGNGSLDCTGLLAPDGDHPNAKGHRVLAAVVSRRL